MNVAIHQPETYIWRGYLNKFLTCNIFVILDHVQFQKDDFQNRNKIKYPNPQGWKWLTIPIDRSKGTRIPINEILIDYKEDWTLKHFEDISSVYIDYPYFHEVMDNIVIPTISDRSMYLADFNVLFIRKVLRYLNIYKKIEFSSEHTFLNKKSHLMFEMCSYFGADNYISGSGAKNYMDVPLFTNNGINVTFLSDQLNPYPTFDNNYIPNLSCLDLLFNHGRDSIKYLGVNK